MADGSGESTGPRPYEEAFREAVEHETAVADAMLGMLQQCLRGMLQHGQGDLVAALLGTTHHHEAVLVAYELGSREVSASMRVRMELQFGELKLGEEAKCEVEAALATPRRSMIVPEPGSGPAN